MPERKGLLFSSRPAMTGSQKNGENLRPMGAGEG